jgi:ABC-type sugar transport system substrate-binding protein
MMRTKFGKKFSFTAVCVIALSMSVFVTTAAFAAERVYKVAYSAQNLANTYFVEIARGFQDRAKEIGADVIVHDGKSDAAGQVTAFENWISQGVDAIVCSPVDPVALEPAVKAAQAAGIRVIATNQDIPGRDAFIVIPEYDYGLVIGRAAGKWIADKLDGEAEVLVLGYPEIEAIIARADGMKEGIKEFAPKSKIVAEISANNPAKGMTAMESALAANPNIEVCVGVNDAGALGAYEAMLASGKANADRMFFGGLDATPEALDAIKDGGVYRATVDIQPYGSGKLFLDTAVKVVENGPLDKEIVIPMKLVDASNISEY